MNEIPYKQWRYEEAMKHGVTQEAIHYRVQRGRYAELKLRRVNKRVVMVQVGREAK